MESSQGKLHRVGKVNRTSIVFPVAHGAEKLRSDIDRNRKLR